MTFTSWSQAGQDLFAYKMCGEKNDGCFLDVGSYHLIMGNNSYSLEQLGWRGLMCDLHKDEENLPKRKSPFIHGDARKVNWLKEIDAGGLPRTIDYLSLDVDDATLETLVALPLGPVKFNVITAEHDAYRVGPAMRNTMRRLLMTLHGYDLVCADVMVDYPEGKVSAFEDWYTSPDLKEVANKYRCEGKHWKEIVGV